jgi:short-subunit dehydrogenase
MARIAIVTGASVGLGREYALQIDQRHDVDEVWLLARRGDLLGVVAAELTHTRGRCFAVDLTDNGSMQPFWQALEAERPEVLWLVNNAGYGKMAPFEQTDLGATLGMVDLNIRALVELTHRVLPYCPRGAHILQIGSSAGWKPMPNFAVYAATKAFVNSFSTALHHELADRGITVTAVCPGPVATEFFKVASGRDVAAPKGVPAADPRDVVRESLRDASRGRARSVHGALIKLYDLAAPLLPTHVVAWTVKRTKL